MATSALVLSSPSSSTITAAAIPPTVRVSSVRASSSSSMAAATTTAKVLPGIIVGGGRVGRALQSMGDGRDVLVGRGQRVPSDFDGPIFVCTRNDDLDAVPQSTPQSRWSAADEKGIVFEDAMDERLCAYSRAVSHFPTAVKEFKWRNGWFYYSMTQKAIAEGKPDPCPLHTAWLQELKIV